MNSGTFILKNYDNLHWSGVSFDTAHMQEECSFQCELSFQNENLIRGLFFWQNAKFCKFENEVPMFKAASCMYYWIFSHYLYCLARVNAIYGYFEMQNVMQIMRSWGAWWLSGRVLDLRSGGCRFEPHWRHCLVSLSKTLYLLLRGTGSWRDRKIVDWHIKNQN